MGWQKGQDFAAPVEIREKRSAVIIRKADLYPVMALMDRLKGLPIKGHTDFFVFARLTAGELQEVEKFEEVDRIFLDEPLTAYLDQAVETTKAKASWNTFEHYGEGITWAIVDSGINDLHPHFGGAQPSAERGTFPAWWHESLTQKDWFQQIQGGPLKIEPGYPGNSVVMRVHLVNGGNLHPHGSHIGGIIAGKQPVPEAGVELPGQPEAGNGGGRQGGGPEDQTGGLAGVG